jgi:hypothetical protein
MSGSSKFAIRLSVEGAQQAGAALKGVPESAAHGVKTLGDASERTGQKMRGLRADTSAATPALKGLDNAAKGVGDAFHSMAGRVPIIGGMLQSMGPAGLAAAAGIAAIGGAFAAMNGMAQKSREYLDDIATQAANMATSAETFQSLKVLAIEQDIEFTKLAEAMNKLQLGSAMAAKGQGELYSTLKRVKPELVEVLVMAETQEDRWDALSRAISGTENHLDKVAIAKAAFGEKGAQFIRMLEGEDKAIGSLTLKYKEMGLVLDEGLVASIAAADTRLDMANKRMEVDGVRAGAAMLPVIESLTNAWNGAQIALGTYIDSLNKLPDQQLSTLHERRKQLAEERDELDADLNRGRYAGVEKFFQGELAEVKRAIAALDVEILRREKAAINKGAVSDGTVITDPTADAEAAAAAARALSERNRMETEALRVRAELGDITGLLSAEEARLQKLREAGLITPDQLTAKMDAYRASLDGTATAQARINAILGEAKTPLERINDEIEALTAAWEASGHKLKDFGAALAVLITKKQDAIAAANALASSVGASAKAADEASNSLNRTSENLGEVRRASLEVELGMSGIVGILDQQIETWEDAGHVALQVLKNIAIQAMMTASQVEGANLGSIIMAGFGAFVGGSGGGASGAQHVSSGSRYGPAGKYHTGGITGAPPMSQLVPMSIFDNAPRNHRGYPLSSDERAAILQVGEPVVSKWDANRIMGAVERSGGSGGVHIEIINQSGGKVEKQQSRRADGGTDVKIFIREAVAAGIAGGDFDGPMASRYGAAPAVR